jgi:predicted dehydrogenase
MGRAHASALSDDPQAEVVAIASLDDVSAQALAKTHDIRRVTRDYQDLLADPEIDLVTIATPDHLHAEIAIAAAQAGKHMIIEKPLTTSLADADRVIAAVRAAGVTAMTLFNHRWVPAYALAQERIAAGQIGEAVLGYARKNDHIYVPTEMLQWASGTTCAWFLSSHDIDLMTWFFNDEAVEVYASAVTKVLRARGIDTPDAIQAQVRYKNGAVATFESCWVYPNTFPTMTDSFMEVIGTDGVIHLPRTIEQFEIATHERYEYPRTQLMTTIHGRQRGAVHAALIQALDCIRTGREPLVTLASSRHVTAILEAIHQSIEAKEPVRVVRTED